MVAPAKTSANAEAMEKGDMRTFVSWVEVTRLANRVYANDERSDIGPSNDVHESLLLLSSMILMYFNV